MKRTLVAGLVGLVVGLVSAAAVAAPTRGSYRWAAAEADACETATSWAEEVAPGLWRAVCGDDDGAELVMSCQEHAWLTWHMADITDANADAAFEDAIMLCNEREGFGVFAGGPEGFLAADAIGAAKGSISTEGR